MRRREPVLIGDEVRRLNRAVEDGRSDRYCLRLWSQVIRKRDGHACVLCRERDRLAAHHIVRKSFMPEAKFQTGNGIALCGRCHREPHEGFNRQPDLRLPADSEGGEKVDLMTGLFGALLDSARASRLLIDDLYFLSESVLAKSKLLQSFDWDTPFPGCRLEQAYLIWRQTPRIVRDALLLANGVRIDAGFVQDDEIAMFVLDG